MSGQQSAATGCSVFGEHRVPLPVHVTVYNHQLHTRFNLGSTVTDNLNHAQIVRCTLAGFWGLFVFLLLFVWPKQPQQNQ